jgi:hypothetical protein
MFLVTRASLALKNPEVVEVVVKKWVEVEAESIGVPLDGWKMLESICRLCWNPMESRDDNLDIFFDHL